MKRENKIFILELSILLSILLIAYFIYNSGFSYLFFGKINKADIQRLAKKFDIVEITKKYETGWRSADLTEPPNFRYGRVYVIEGKNSKGEEVKLIVDPYEASWPEKTAFLMKKH